MNLKISCVLLLVLLPTGAFAQSGTVIFHEPGFPTADSAPIPEALLQQALPGAQFATAAALKQQLSSAKLLVLPYGSAFPENAWADVQGFLRRGGNLLVIGGRPFTRAAYQENGTWKLRDYSVRYTRPLLIDQYQETPGSADLKFESNPDVPLSLPQFSWKQGFSPIIHLSAAAVYTRIGSAGSIDSNLDVFYPAYIQFSPLPSGTMAYGIEVEDAVLYILSSDTAQDGQIDLKDKITGVRLTLTLPAQHAAMALIGKKEKAVIAKYGF